MPILPYFPIPDGTDELRDEIALFAKLIARTARWVHPDTFRALPVWFPEHARGFPRFKADWSEPQRNAKRNLDVNEANISAGKALVAALGTKKVPGWTVCHIWGRDDPRFQLRNDVVRDPRFYSCVANMIWLPTPLKGFTDAVPEIKMMLRVCAFHTYGWACEHEGTAEAAAQIRAGLIPDGYPESWPRSPGHLPPGTAPHSPRVQAAIAARKEDLKWKLDHHLLPQFPRTSVRDVMAFWKMTL